MNRDDGAGVRAALQTVRLACSVRYFASTDGWLPLHGPITLGTGHLPR